MANQPPVNINGLVPDILNTPAADQVAPSGPLTLEQQMNAMTPEQAARGITVGDLVAPVASQVAGSDVFKPELRQMAGDFAAQNAAEQAAVAAPQGATPSLEVPQQAEQVAAAVQSAVQPTAQDHAEAAQKILAPKRMDRAAGAAVEQNAAEEAAFAAQALQRQQEIQASLDKLKHETDNAVRAHSLPEILNGGTFGNKLLASFAVMLGGYSQGLTGSKTNPAIEAIDTAVEQQAQKDKLNAGQKESLRSQLLQYSSQNLAAMQRKTDNSFKKQQIAQAQQDIELKRREVDLKQMEVLGKLHAAKVGKAAEGDVEIRREDFGQLSEAQQKRLVRVPSGGYKLASNPETAKVLNEFKAGSDPALSAIDSIKRLGNKISVASRANPYSPERAALVTELGGLLANLRVPLLGPGTMQQKEYERLQELIGSPANLLKSPEAEMAKLNQVQKMLKRNLNINYQNAGIQVPPSRREQYIQRILKDNAGKISPEQAEQAIYDLEASGRLPKLD